MTMAIAILIPVLAVLLSGILLMRFRKRSLAAFNAAVTNKITGRFADRLPGFGIVTHLARKSGRVYRTPVNVFQAPNGFLVALTYGRESGSRTYWRPADASSRLAGGVISSLRQLSCTILPGSDSRFPCA